MKTYNKERIIVGLILCIPLLWNYGWLELISIIAVWYTFNYVQVATRMQEKESAKKNPSVECHRKLNKYYWFKEFYWIAFFILSGAYSPIIGSVTFLLYPIWRKYYNNKKIDINNHLNLIPVDELASDNNFEALSDLNHNILEIRKGIHNNEIPKDTISQYIDLLEENIKPFNIKWDFEQLRKMNDERNI